MNHLDLSSWKHVGDAVLIVLAYAVGPAAFILSGFAIAKEPEDTVFADLILVGIGATVLAHLISAGIIK